MRRFWLILSVCFSAVPAIAGQVTLKNGDVLKGELRGIDSGLVVWQSDNLGTLRLPKNQVVAVESSTELKMRGESAPCLWRGMEGQRVHFVCGERTRVYSLLTLKHVVPYEGHQKANYAYGGNLRITGWRQDGNTNAEHWELLTNVRLRHADLRHEVQFSHNSQKTITVDFANDLSISTRNQRIQSHYSLGWFFLPAWFWANKISAEQDDFRNIQEEYRIASGIGHQFWEHLRSALDAEAGLQYNRTYLKTQSWRPNPDAYTALRLAGSYHYQWTGGQRLYVKSQYNRSLHSPDEGQAERWELRADSGLNFPIGFGISANFSVDWAYVNHARDQNPNAAKKDTTYRVGVNYAW